jgi:chorismate mutase
MDVRSTSLSRRAALTGLGGVALLAAAACSPSKEATSTQPAGQTNPPATVDPNASLAEQNKIIDDLDKQIIDLLKQRNDAAEAVQKIPGGSASSNDQKVIANYTAGLGAGGAAVAKAILGTDSSATSTSSTSTTATSTTATSTSH